MSDYHEIGCSIADTIAKASKPLTLDQKRCLIAAVAVWLNKRDDEDDREWGELAAKAVGLELWCAEIEKKLDKLEGDQIDTIIRATVECSDAKGSWLVLHGDVGLRAGQVVCVVTDPDVVECPNCVSPWKCNGPHIGDALGLCPHCLAGMDVGWHWKGCPNDTRGDLV